MNELLLVIFNTLHGPFSPRTIEKVIRALKVGDEVLISGVVFTERGVGA